MEKTNHEYRIHLPSTEAPFAVHGGLPILFWLPTSVPIFDLDHIVGSGGGARGRWQIMRWDSAYLIIAEYWVLFDRGDCSNAKCFLHEIDEIRSTGR